MSDDPICYIFIGRSGCGKGTQAKLLFQYLENKSSTPILKIESGKYFRKFIEQDSYSSQLSKEIMAEANRQPSFLAIHFWADILISQFTGQEQVVFDGSPRSLNEAKVLDIALSFYGFSKRHVIYLETSKDLARERLISRGRADDLESADVENRISWFDTDVYPAIEFLKTKEEYNVLTIDGGQEIEEIHQDIIKNL